MTTGAPGTWAPSSCHPARTAWSSTPLSISRARGRARGCRSFPRSSSRSPSAAGHRHFVDDIGPVSEARVEVDEYGWERVRVAGEDHPHTFARTSGEVRTTAVTVAGQQPGQRAWVVSGLKDLVLLKSTGSAFA